MARDYEDDAADVKRRYRLDQRADRWHRELDRKAMDRKLQYERQQQDAKRRLEWQRDDAKRAIERQGQDTRRGIEASSRDAGGAGGAGGRGGFGGGARADVARYQEMDDLALRAAVYIAGALAVVAAFVLATGHIAALAYDGAFPSYRLDDVPGILTRFVGNLGDPAAAWEPVNTGGEVPGPLGWWAIFTVLVLLVGALAFLAYAVHSTSPGAQVERPRTDWAKASSLAALRIPSGTDPGPGRLVVGTSGRNRLALGPRHSLLVVGPAHAGKTSGLAIPALLEWPGPAVVASTKSHLMDETIGWRSHQGDVHVFDPAAITRYHRSGWTMLSDCGTWQGAIRMAQHLTAAAQALPDARVDGTGGSGGSGGTGEGAGARSQLWSSAMAMSLAPFLYAAAADGRSIMDAAQWIEREERDEVLTILRRIDQGAAHAHETTFFRDDPSRSQFFHLMFQVLSVYSDPAVAATAAKHEIVPAELLDGGQHTLYLTAPEHDQVRFQPLFAAIVRQLLTAVNDRFAADGTPLDPPILFLLDEAFGVATVEDLAAMASTGAAKGVQVVSIFQDMGRFEGLRADAAGLLAKNHRAMLVVGGDHDLAGVAEPSDERLFWADLGAMLGKGEAALLYGTPKPVKLRLRPWYRDAELSRRVDTAQDAVAPSEKRLPSVYRSPLDTAPAFSIARQTGAWLRSRKAAPGEEADGTPHPRRGEEQFDDVIDLPEDDPPPDNVTQLPSPADRPRR